VRGRAGSSISTEIVVDRARVRSDLRTLIVSSLKICGALECHPSFAVPEWNAEVDCGKCGKAVVDAPCYAWLPRAL
jgi:hypothetical protein